MACSACNRTCWGMPTGTNKEKSILLTLQHQRSPAQSSKKLCYLSLNCTRAIQLVVICMTTNLAPPPLLNYVSCVGTGYVDALSSKQAVMGS